MCRNSNDVEISMVERWCRDFNSRALNGVETLVETLVVETSKAKTSIVKVKISDAKSATGAQGRILGQLLMRLSRFVSLLPRVFRQHFNRNCFLTSIAALP